MADFFQKITEHQGTVEDVIRKVPGFKGYLELEDRRDADRLLREQLARSFEEQVAALGTVQQELIAAGGLAHLETLQRIDTKLRTFIDRIQSAAQGYAGLFAPIKIGAEELKALYAFDNGLVVYRDQLETGIAALRDAAAGGDVAGVLRQIDGIVTEANDTFKRRVEAMQNLAESV